MPRVDVVVETTLPAVRWTVVESNFCAPGSYVSATPRTREAGGSRIEIHWERTPTSFKAG